MCSKITLKNTIGGSFLSRNLLFMDNLLAIQLVSFHFLNLYDPIHNFILFHNKSPQDIQHISLIILFK